MEQQPPLSVCYRMLRVLLSRPAGSVGERDSSMSAERKMRHAVLLAERVLATYVAGESDSKSALAALVSIFDDAELVKAVVRSYRLDLRSTALSRSIH